MTTPHSTTTDDDARRIGRWLAAWAAMLFVLVLLGGGTRLTESGLSITEWKPVTGVIPPLTDAAWQVEFGKYQRIPQYAKLNAGMSLGDFKGIYWWEFLHRLWARLVGLVFVAPLAWLTIRRRLPRVLLPRLAALGVLMGLQGAMGWYMVASGLTARVTVSQYRLAAHLSLALVIYVATVWMADGLLTRGTAGMSADVPTSDVDGDARVHAGRGTGPANSVRRWIAALLALAFVTVVSGAFVAGLRAGKIYNEFPMMGAGLVPAEYASLSPWWKNLFENPAAAQFNHRLLATLLFLAVLAIWVRSRGAAGATLQARMNLVFVAAGVQVALGITVLLLAVPVAIGVAHQAGALLLLTALTLALSAERRR